MMKMFIRTTIPLLVATLVIFAGAAYAADKPNIVVIWGDDIGQSNISAYGIPCF